MVLQKKCSVVSCFGLPIEGQLRKQSNMMKAPDPKEVVSHSDPLHQEKQLIGDDIREFLL